VALERSEAKRREYAFRMGLMYSPDQVVFVDESAFDRRACDRGRAYALKGHCVQRKCFFIRGQRYLARNCVKTITNV
jgi:hypothetical protein